MPNGENDVLITAAVRAVIEDLEEALKSKDAAAVREITEELMKNGVHVGICGTNIIRTLPLRNARSKGMSSDMVTMV